MRGSHTAAEPPKPARSAAERRGAYGLQITGLDDAALLGELPRGRAWPLVRVRQAPLPAAGSSPSSERSWVDRDSARVGLKGGGCAAVVRATGTATMLMVDGESTDRLAHPFLSVVGVLFAGWQGHDALHGGAFVADGGAWALLGDRGSGKSTLLAGLALGGHPVLADDLLVEVDGNVLAGPRCVDLRPDAREQLTPEAIVQPVRGKARRRLLLDAAIPQAPLRGWILLSWGPQLRIRQVGPAERLEALAAQRCAGTGLLALAELPAWELQRPRTWDSFETTAKLVRELAAG